MKGFARLSRQTLLLFGQWLGRWSECGSTNSGAKSHVSSAPGRHPLPIFDRFDFERTPPAWGTGADSEGGPLPIQARILPTPTSVMFQKSLSGRK
jgi:hypothetical protein